MENTVSGDAMTVADLRSVGISLDGEGYVCVCVCVCVCMTRYGRVKGK
jgi:hypothetical protein